MSKVPIIAFFDVDETLIRTKSMFAFVRFLERLGVIAGVEEIISSLRRLSDQGTDRAEINRLYWKSYNGLEVQAVRGAAHQWVEEERKNNPDFLIASAMGRLKAHREANHHIALVSGSGVDILRPLATLIKADFVLATQLQETDGRYTGKIIPPVMIGAGKAESAAKLTTQLHTKARHCFAYGDHISDLPLLDFVGHPSVVGEEGPLADHARQQGWPVLSAKGTLTAEVAA